jgi:hypothetical protein
MYIYVKVDKRTEKKIVQGKIIIYICQKKNHNLYHRWHNEHRN